MGVPDSKADSFCGGLTLAKNLGWPHESTYANRIHVIVNACSRFPFVWSRNSVLTALLRDQVLTFGVFPGQ